MVRHPSENEEIAAVPMAHSPVHVPGYVDGIDDPSMGWARYAQTIRIFVLNSGLFYIQPSNRTARATRSLLLLCCQSSDGEDGACVQVNLMDRINEYLKHNKAWDQTVRLSRPYPCFVG